MTMRGTVLAYHAVEDSIPASDAHELTVTTRAFAEQMDLLARMRRVVPLADVVEGRVPPGKPAVAITFDDGYRGVLESAAPILKAHGFAATLFVPTAHIGGRNRWDDLDDEPFRVLTGDELRELEAYGVAVESHGHQHIHYDTSPVDDVRRDIAESTAILSEVLGRRPAFLAYPWGPSSAASRRLVAEAGYLGAFSIDEPHNGRFAFGRVPVRPGDSLAKYRLKTSGRYQAVRYSRATTFVATVTRPVRRRGADGRAGG